MLGFDSFVTLGSQSIDNITRNKCDDYDEKIKVKRREVIYSLLLRYEWTIYE